MNFIRFIRLAAALSLLALPGAYAATVAELDQAMAHDGLQKITVKGIDLAYARPGATLADYKRVRLDPIQVAFHKDWDPKRTGSNLKLSTSERENIKNGVSQLVQEEFTRELQAKDAYQVVNESGPDVLRVKASIVNLYVNAPDTQSPGRSRTYTVSAGEMTIFVELFDSETGELIARMVDRSVARDTGTMNISNSVANSSEARAIASAWARILRNGLDKAHGIGK
jgi:hypothetical protein